MVKRAIFFFLVALVAVCTQAFGATALSFREFIGRTHGDLLKANPALFCFKMRKAAESNFMFFRAFPELFYEELAREPEAKLFAKTPPIMLVGDAHTDNLEVAESRENLIPQYNDFEDSAEGPAALDIARALTCAYLLSEESSRTATEIVAEARKAYKDALHKNFKEWTREIQDESAVEETYDKYLDWSAKAESPVPPKESARLAKALGLNSNVWKAFIYNKAGMSSIGQPRILFLSARSEAAYELKGLDKSAVEAFTGFTRPADDGERIEEAYKIFRQVPAKAETVYLDGRTWIFRKRDPWKSLLNGERATSSSRVMAGLLAQQHRNQATIGELEQAVSVVTPSVLASSIRKVRQQRNELEKLLGRGAWGCTKFK